MRGHLVQRFGELEVVAKLLGGRAFSDFLRPWLRPQRTIRPEFAADCADEFGVLGRAFDEDVPRAIERRRLVADVVTQERRRGLLGDECRIGQQAVGKGFQTGLTGDLGLGPPLRLVGEIDVLDPCLGVGGQQRRPQLVGELALLLDGGQHCGPAVVEFPQVAEALLEGAELAVVEAAGDLLAVPGDERNGGAFVQQPDGGRHPGLGHGQFLSETGVYGLDGWARGHARRHYRIPLTGPRGRTWRVTSASRRPSAVGAR